MRILSRFSLLAALAATPALATPSDCVNTARVRAFSAAEAGAVIVKEGAKTYRRIEVDARCPLDDAAHLYFQQGPGQPGVLYTGGRQIPVVRKDGLTQRFCAKTPATAIVVSDYWGDRHTRCAITNIAPATREAFEAGKRVDVR